mmetsp:Transcript_17478/g.54020  ORF Transcript_17478/g.54020 Transcript_17478/m.54020 type:complete len:318 (+) Transcript_17478:52-1005(+)
MLKTIGAALLFAWNAAGLRPPQAGAQRHGYAGYQFTHHFHIAKTAGSSAHRDLQALLSEPVSSGECCWPHEEVAQGTVGHVIAMLRDPKAHVYSQFNHCLQNFDSWFDPVNFPSTFQEWMQFWVARGDMPGENQSAGNGFHCYLPYNLQTRALSCTAKYCMRVTCAVDWEVLGGPQVESFALNKSVALENVMHGVHVLGLTDFYQESLCLVYASFHGELPDWCACEDRQAWDAFGESKETHGSNYTAVGAKTFSAEELQLVQQLTQLDQEVYDAAVKRFEADIARVEQQYGKKILCSNLYGKDAKSRRATALIYDFD